MRLHALNRWRIQQRNNIRTASIYTCIIITISFAIYGAYSGGKYIAELHGEAVSLRSDNEQAMAMLSGQRYTVDGVEYRIEEVKQMKLIGGL